VPYFLFRQWWSVVGGFVVGAVAAAFSGALLIGWERNLEYLKRAFGGMAEMIGLPVDAESLPAIAPVDWIGSISATSTSARWSESLGMGTGVFLFFVGVVALVCLLLGWWCYRAHGQRLFAQRGGVSGRQDPENDPLVLFEWLGLMTAALAFGPQTKLRHMIIIIPVVLLAARYLVVPKRGVSQWPLLVAMILAFFFQIWPFADFGEGGVTEKIWRYNGGPIWFFLLLYFAVLWTGLKTLAVSGDSSKLAADSG
jgi:hypothetical protein